MELTKELKAKLDKAQTKEEAKKIIEEAGMTLDDAELDQVAGGFGSGIDSEASRIPMMIRR